MRIKLSLNKTVFEKNNYKGVEHTSRVTSFDIGARDALSTMREDAEIKRATDLKPIIDAFAAKAIAAFPDKTFSISVLPKQGDRKPPGFDKLVRDHKEDPLGLDRHVKTVEKGAAHAVILAD